MVIWAKLPPAGNRYVDDVVLHLAHRPIPQAPTVQGPRLEVLDHDVRARRKPEKDVAPFGSLNVEREASLVTVHRGMSERNARAGKHRGNLAIHLAARDLDLDDVGAEIGEGCCAHWAGPGGRRLQHPYACKRPRQVSTRL